ncbi:mitogen-activated protein kinase kinase kinase npk1 [Phtheirospermum japonicum]|uniref:Mitogen-activated protein kinase kinase kinase npk1 n=1 Tax=Phtheirospermum japonicum TaxID=374723 RepID=A0A830BQN8_9LAMI|nr:mitogen-activated protein kinase kinase kinase npk1 [Phtheirospermum japonicum]
MPEMIMSRCTKSILTALVHIHKLGYVHCDVKPHNVLLSERGHAKLVDFGSCVSIDAGKSYAGKSCDFRGTVVYAAPESIARQKFVPESDIWALGCSVLQMLTGKSPWVFDKKTEVKDALFRIGCSIPEIPTNNKISKEAKDFLRKCLVKDPTARWKADMLIDHPFVQKPDHPLTASNCSTHHQHQRHHGIHSIVPHCFHVPKVQAC